MATEVPIATLKLISSSKVNEPADVMTCLPNRTTETAAISPAMRQALLILLLILATGLGPNWASRPALAAEPTLLVIGDSISAAYGINRRQGWVALLQQRLTIQGYPHQMINASVSGDTTRNGLNKLPQLLEKHQPTVVIIALGGNDGLRGLPLSEIENNISLMITKSQSHGSQVMLAGIRLPPNYGEAFNNRFSAIYQQLASHHKIPLITRLLDQVADYKQLMQADGIHPTAEAQMQILDNIWPKLKPLLLQPENNTNP